MCEIEEEYRKFAKFMGHTQNPNNGVWNTVCPFDGEGHHLETMKYGTSWEWLMPVVEKIEDIDTINGTDIEFRVVIYEDEVKIIIKNPRHWQTIVEVDSDGSGKKANLYKALLKFVEWYNDQLNSK